MLIKIRSLSVIATLVTVAVLPGAALAQQPLNLRLGIVTNVQTTLGGEFVTTFADTVKSKSAGRLNIQVFDKGQLGGDSEMISNIRVGNLGIALINASVLSAVEPAFTISDMPFIWRTREQAHKAVDGEIGAEMRRLAEVKGIKVLATGEWGYRALLVRGKAVNTLADLKGLKVRVAESPLSIATWRSVGSNPVPMSWTEVYMGYQQGSIDGVETNPVGMRDGKLYEVAKHLALTNHSFTSLVMIMNLDQWKALPADLQAIVQEAAIAGQRVNRQRAHDANEEAIAFMQKNGVTVTRLDPVPFRNATQGVYKQFAVQVGSALLNNAIEAGK